jgi:hypothetical protein
VTIYESTDYRNKRRPIRGTAPVLVSLLLLLAAAVPIFSGTTGTAAAPDSVDLSGYNRTAGPVSFVHKDHGGTSETKPDCSVCHHTTARGQVPEKCSTCHQPLDDSAAPTDAVAFHMLCIGCHKAQIERGNKRLSLACDSCHLANGVK